MGRINQEPQNVIAETRSGIRHLREKLMAQEPFDPRNPDDRGALARAIVYESSLPQGERYSGTEVIAKLWENHLLPKTPQMESIGRQAFIVYCHYRPQDTPDAL